MTEIILKGENSGLLNDLKEAASICLETLLIRPPSKLEIIVSKTRTPAYRAVRDALAGWGVKLPIVEEFESLFPDVEVREYLWRKWEMRFPENLNNDWDALLYEMARGLLRLHCRLAEPLPPSSLYFPVLHPAAGDSVLSLLADTFYIIVGDANISLRTGQLFPHALYAQVMRILKFPVDIILPPVPREFEETRVVVLDYFIPRLLSALIPYTPVLMTFEPSISSQLHSFQKKLISNSLCPHLRRYEEIKEKTISNTIKKLTKEPSLLLSPWDANEVVYSAWLEKVKEAYGYVPSQRELREDWEREIQRLISRLGKDKLPYVI